MRTPAGGAEYLATHIDALRKQNRNTLVVSAGDNIGASPLVSGLFHDEPTIEAFNAMGVDISSVGNHEFDEGSAELLRMQDGGCHPVDGCQDGDGFAGADFDYLAANVTDDDTGKTLFRPYEIRRVGGVKVGFIGVVLKDTPTIVTPSGVEGLTFGDEADAINKYTAVLKKKGVRAIVVLMHQGDTVALGQVNDCLNPVGPLADLIGRSSKEVDLYLTGHTHQAYNCVIGGKRATSASSFGRVLTDANLRVDRRTGQVVSVSADNKIVTQDVAKDPAQTTILNKYTAISAPIANRRIGAATAALTTEQNAAGEEVLGDIIADSQLAATAPDGFGNAVVAFMNPGGIRTNIDAGDITYGEAFAVQPFGNSLVTLTLTGAQIDRVLEQQWDGQGTSPKVLQVSNGLTYTWSASGPLGSRVDPSTIKINGTTVDPAASYRVTVNSFLADGGDGFTELQQRHRPPRRRGRPRRAGGVSEPAGERSDRAHAARPHHRRAVGVLPGRRAGTIHPVPARPSMPTAQDVRGALRRRVRRVRGDLWGILQTTIAAGAAWFLANLLHSQPFFAPAAAVIAMGVSRGGRTVRAIELVVGVAVGIVVADVIVRWLGANTLVLMLVVGLSMAAALLFGAGQILVNQAAISGILVVATLQPGSSPSPARALDALIGGAVALLVGQVLFPRDPVRAMAKAARAGGQRPLGGAQGPRRGAARRRRGSAPGARSRWRATPTTTSPPSSTPSPWRARPSPCATRAGARASASRSTPRPPSRWTTPCATRACSPVAR